MKTAADILIEARAYLDKGWCQGASGRTETGGACWPLDERARSWCLTGALQVATGTEDVFSGWQEPDPMYEVARLMNKGTPGIGQGPEWNNEPGRTKEEVLDAFDRAISLALDEASA